MALTPAEKQRRYRERRKNNPEKEAASKKKDLERYHAKKRLVRDLSSREHRALKKKWRAANAKRRDRAKALRIVMHTPESSPGIMTSRLTPNPQDHDVSRVLLPIRRLSTPQLSTPPENKNSPDLSHGGQDIFDASHFYLALKDISKVKLHLITDEDIKICSSEIPENIVPLSGTMKVHQVFTEEEGVLKYRDLSCFCQRGFCSCMDSKEYRPLKPVDELSIHSIECESDFLKDIGNLMQSQENKFYNTVYGSDSDDDIPLKTLKDKTTTEKPSTSKGIDDDSLIEKENIHVNKIKQGVCVLVKVSGLKQDYVYLGKALSEVEDDGEVKIMFFKSVDDTAKTFKLVETDLSYEPFENLLAIVAEPKKVNKGKRV